MLLMRYCSHRFSIPCEKRLTNFSRRSWLAAARGNLSCSFAQNGNMDVSLSNNSTFSGMEDVLMGYIFGKEKATKVAHLVWKHVVQKGDTVVDATCGNGYDTLAMLKMVADGSGRGCVYGMDIQKDALENTSSLLNESVNPIESGYQRCKKFNAPRKELVKLFTICHSRMEEVVPKSTTLRLVAFNLGYLPGGDKEVTTTSATTVLALQAATRILASGGLISLVVYVGHPGGRDELETIQAFASELSVEDWVCSEFQMLNRPLAPIHLKEAGFSWRKRPLQVRTDTRRRRTGRRLIGYR